MSALEVAARVTIGTIGVLLMLAFVQMRITAAPARASAVTDEVKVTFRPAHQPTRVELPPLTIVIDAVAEKKKKEEELQNAFSAFVCIIDATRAGRRSHEPVPNRHAVRHERHAAPLALGEERSVYGTTPWRYDPLPPQLDEDETNDILECAHD